MDVETRVAVLEAGVQDLRAATAVGFQETHEHLDRQDERMDTWLQAASDAQSRALSQWPASAQIAVGTITLSVAGVIGALAAWAVGFLHS